MEYWVAVSTGLVANLLYTLAVLGLATAAGVAFARRRRKRIFEFFRLQGTAPNIRIILSRLDIPSGCSEGTDGRLLGGYVGPALMESEYKSALHLQDVVVQSGLDRLPRLLRSPIERASSFLARIESSIEVCPKLNACAPLLGAGTHSLVILGSDVYTPVSRFAYDDPASFMRVVDQTTAHRYNPLDESRDSPTIGIRAEQGYYAIPARRIQRELGSIQRVTLRTGRTVLMCTGTSDATTARSVEYLSSEWTRLHNEMGSDDFLVVFACTRSPDGGLGPPERLRDFDRRRSIGRR